MCVQPPRGHHQPHNMVKPHHIAPTRLKRPSPSNLRYGWVSPTRGVGGHILRDLCASARSRFHCHPSPRVGDAYSETYCAKGTVAFRSHPSTFFSPLSSPTNRNAVPHHIQNGRMGPTEGGSGTYTPGLHVRAHGHVSLSSFTFPSFTPNTNATRAGRGRIYSGLMCERTVTFRCHPSPFPFTSQLKCSGGLHYNTVDLC